MKKAPLPDSVWIGQVSLIIFQAVIFFLKWKSRAIFCICIGVLGNVFVKKVGDFCVIHRKNVYLHRISVNQSLQHVFFGDSATPQRALISKSKFAICISRAVISASHRKNPILFYTDLFFIQLTKQFHASGFVIAFCGQCANKCR